MQTLIEILGFTTLENGIWNTVSYLAFTSIIIGVFWERGRNILITIGAGALALYAGIFLHNYLFTALQVLIIVSGVLQWLKVSQRPAMITVTFLTIATYVFLAFNGIISNTWAFTGSLGLLGIAFGLIILPKHYGFIIMAIGGVFLVLYAFNVQAWVFFLLNIFFAGANIYTWRKVITNKSV